MTRLTKGLILAALFVGICIGVAFADNIDMQTGRSPTSTVERWAKESIVIGAAATSGSVNFATRGTLNMLVFKVPNWTNVVTAVVTITNADGYVIYTSPARDRNNTYVTSSLDVPIQANNVVTVTLSGVPGGTGGTAELQYYTK